MIAFSIVFCFVFLMLDSNFKPEADTVSVLVEVKMVKSEQTKSFIRWVALIHFFNHIDNHMGAISSVLQC